ncbi:MAG TPA: thrombospondin type 3 repeat-containing protein, partial [Chitinophagaceae bacterium]|nr:thrombospondin type 3 repeat-containing protein [Chitinophagaceae bacterium]
MKKLILSILTILLYTSSFSQDGNYRKQSALGVSFFFNDFQTAADIKKNGFGSVIRQKNLFNTKRMNPGLALNYLKGFTNHIDFAGSLGGSFVDYPIANLPSKGNHFLLEATAGLNLKLLPDNYWVVPFAHVGIGASKYSSHYAAFMPVGAGLQINLVDEAFIIFNSQYRLAVTDQAAPHLYHSIGIAGIIGQKKEAPPKVVEIPVVEPPKDRDSDGIIDSLDGCPDQAGPASLNGCPDRDNDNIADKDDNCPDVAGLAKYKGCPIPDTDKDGINDEEDKCKDVVGVARYMGCPPPDTDRDGVIDEEDKCPNEAGPASNFGCPVIQPEVIEKVNLAARNIFFATGSAKLLAKSYPSLDNV